MSSTRLGATASAPDQHQGHGAGDQQHMTGLKARLAGAWLFVGIPLAYGIVKTVEKAAALFTG